MGHAVIVGAGPAGATLGYLLARNGVRVTLLERHTDFQREFRGEVLLPSGLEPFAQMGLWQDLEALPQVPLRGAQVYFEGGPRLRVDFDPQAFGRFAPRWISQPALLEMLAARAAEHAGFRLERGAVATALVEEGGRYVGVRAKQDGSERELRADLVVGADGRASVVRRRAALGEHRDAVPMDVVWTKLPPLAAFAEDPVFRVYLGRGHLLISAPVYDGHLQVAWIIRKGTFGEVRRRGMSACLEEMARHVSPDLGEHLRRHANDAIDPFLLSTVSDYVDHWCRPGLLVLGDAAHTMSPVGAQGINVAIRDAVVAANHLVPVLANGASPRAVDAAARSVEAERAPEVREIQRVQSLPPRLILRRDRWSGWLLGGLLRLAALPPAAARAAPAFARFASGPGRVRLAV